MDVFEAIQKRKSIRSYEPMPIQRETIEKLLEAARAAPSAKNRQPWHFIVVTESEKKKELSKGLYAKFLANAPMVIVACGNEKVSPNWYVVDVALAMENMVLAATGEGLGTCYVGSFDEHAVKRLLKIPEALRVLVLLAVGYPREKKSLGRRNIGSIRKPKSLSEIVSYEEYDHSYEKKEK